MCSPIYIIFSSLFHFFGSPLLVFRKSLLVLYVNAHLCLSIHSNHRHLRIFLFVFIDSTVFLLWDRRSCNLFSTFPIVHVFQV